MVWTIGYITFASLCIDRFLCEWVLFCNANVSQLGNYVRKLLFFDTCCAKLQNQLVLLTKNHTHEYMLEQSLCAPSTPLHQYMGGIGGTCEERLIEYAYICPNTSGGVKVLHLTTSSNYGFNFLLPKHISLTLNDLHYSSSQNVYC